MLDKWQFMEEALEEAKMGMAEGGIPIGCVVVRNGEIVARGHNQRVQKGSNVLHGEMDALENLGRQEPSFYSDVTLFTTLSPCNMCSGAILLYKIPCVVIGENRTFLGAEELLKNNGVKVEVLNDDKCFAIMQDFIAKHPKLWHEDIGKRLDLFQK